MVSLQPTSSPSETHELHGLRKSVIAFESTNLVNLTAKKGKNVYVVEPVLLHSANKTRNFQRFLQELPRNVRVHLNQYPGFLKQQKIFKNLRA